MAPRIYRSSLPDVPLPQLSIFSFLFSSDNNPVPQSSIAFIDAVDGRALTRAQLKSNALQCAWGLRNTLGLQRGDTIMVFSPNSLAYPVILFGAVAAGLMITFANASYTHSELAHQYKDSRASYIFVHPSLLPVVQRMFDTIAVDKNKASSLTILMGLRGDESGIRQASSSLRCLPDLISGTALANVEPFDGQASRETVYMCYSSGTTGLSKGVETMHNNVTSVLKLLRTVLQPVLEPANNDVVLGILPFYHIYGLVVLCHLMLFQGAPCVICPRFEPQLFCSSIQKYKVTTVFIAPPILVFLNNHPIVDQFDLSTLRCLANGAAPLPSELVDSVVKRLKSRGATITIPNGYGLTETSPASHVLRSSMAMKKLGSVGEIFPNLEARLVDDNEDDVMPGESGEIWIRGPVVMKGYVRNPAANKNALTPDGWFKTGDIARVDHDGYFYIVDRKKELIKYKGYQVPPAELEDILLGHPDIADVGVIGIEDRKQATELPRAYVVPRRGMASLATEEARQAFSTQVSRWMESKVAKHKYLRGGVVPIEAIPKSPAGKILRRELRLQAQEELAKEGQASSKL